MSKYIKILFLGLIFASCSNTTVGGSRIYGEGNKLKFREDRCNGSCMQFSSEGKCIKFTRGISEICIDYFNNLDK